jgi:hypothetical protein
MNQRVWPLMSGNRKGWYWIPAIISRQVPSRKSRYVAAKSFSNSSSESLAPSSVNQTDLFLFAGSEI